MKILFYIIMCIPMALLIGGLWKQYHTDRVKDLEAEVKYLRKKKEN